MPFTDTQRKEARERAAYCCCICRKIGFVQVHHIIPEGQDGPNTLDNAVPLCADCHDKYGANPDKRKQIREMRDWWYRQVATGIGPGLTPDVLRQVSTRVEASQAGQKKVHDLNELKSLLETIMHDAIEKITPQTARSLSSDVIGLGAKLHANNFVCPRCNTATGFLLDNACPRCGTKMALLHVGRCG